MSTRVDKGGPKFKPILKSKARPSATPAPQDARTRPSVEPVSSMPPPSSIPERIPSVAPMPRPPSTTPIASETSNAIHIKHSVPPRALPIKPSRATPAVVQTPKPQGGGNVISLPGTRPPSPSAKQSGPSRATSVDIQAQAHAGEPGPSHPDNSSLPSFSSAPIASPPGDASGSSVLEPFRGVPIDIPRSSSTSTITPIPSTSSKGKKRAALDTTDAERTDDYRSDPQTNANPSDGRGSVAQKRPKLSILQAEEDRIKKRPARRAKSKKTYVESDIEDENAEQATSEAEGKKKKRASRKKKAVDENAEEETAMEGSPKVKRTRAKRKPKPTQDGETGDTAEVSDSPSESPAPPKKRRRRVAAAETPGPEGTPEPIDPTQVKMSAICDDPGSGRVSSRWETSQIQHAEARKRAREERARAVAEVDEEERETGRIGAKKSVPKPALPGEQEVANAAGEESVVENTGQNPDEFTYTESLKASHYAPQVRIGADGEIVLDMESLQVDRAADPEFAEEAYSHVEESDQSKFTNSSSWSKRRVVRWGKEDTALFYDALRQFGQNFDLIARVLPGRTYRMCKNKFKAEDKKNSGLIDDALKNGVAVDLNALSRMTGKDFTGPTPVIEAKKTLNLGDDGASGDHAGAANGDEPDAQKESRTSGVESGMSVEENTENGNMASESEPLVRLSASPPPPNTLLSTITTTRQSASPPAPESLLGPIGTMESSLDPCETGGTTQPPSVAIAVESKRTPVAISAPTRTRSQAITAAPAPSVEVNAQQTGTSAKKKGKKKPSQEEGVEVLGLVDEHLDD